MRKSKAEAAETRQRIIRAAMREFRRNGIHATGVADVMAAAGLSHGGFYRHFASKEQLVAEACAAGLDEQIGTAETLVDGGRDAIVAHVEALLSRDSRDDHIGGCMLASMGSELARSDLNTRHVASHGFRELIEVFAKYYEGSTSSAEGDAIFAISAMVGVVTMSRIVDDTELSDRILSEAKRRLIAQLQARVPSDRYSGAHRMQEG